MYIGRILTSVPWSENYYSVKGQVEATRTLLPIKIVHQKQYHIPGRVAEISAIIRT